MNITTGSRWILYIGAAIVLFAIVVSIQNNNIKKENESLKQSNNLLEASKDSMRTKWNDDSKRFEYDRQTFKAENKALEEYLKENEKELYNLKKKNKAVVGIQTEAELRIDTIVVTVIDTVKDARIANVKNEWYEANVKSYPDSTKLNVKAYSYPSYSIDEKGKLIVTEKNPYIQQKNINSFYVQPKKTKSKFWRGVAVGAGIVGGGILILK